MNFGSGVIARSAVLCPICDGTGFSARGNGECSLKRGVYNTNVPERTNKHAHVNTHIHSHLIIKVAK